MNKFSAINFFTYYLNPPSKLKLNDFVAIKALNFFHRSTVVPCTTTTMSTLNKYIILFLNVNPRLLWITILFLLTQVRIEPWRMMPLYLHIFQSCQYKMKSLKTPIDVNVYQQLHWFHWSSFTLTHIRAWNSSLWPQSNSLNGQKPKQSKWMMLRP